MGSSDGSSKITILHFNDVYNIEARQQEPVGGVARFTTAVKSRAHKNPLVLFSGDAFNPSLMSAVTKGKQMVPALNAVGVHCAVYGNHDFDFGVDKLVAHAKATNFPWLLSNVIDNDTGRPLADGIPTRIIDWQGKKLGLLGLVEEEWIATLSTVDEDDITYLDFVEEGRALAQGLREQGADYIIALTHMRWPNDERLAREVEEIDLILGGHDHDFNVKEVNGKYVIKSGTDFRQLGELTLSFGGNNNKPKVDIKEVTIDSSIEEDEEVKSIVNDYIKIMGTKMERILGQMEVEMDGRFSKIRTQETNLGNFITNIMLESTNAEVAILNSGTLRSDTVHPKGDFKIKDLLAILPIVDSVVVLQVTGTQLLEALENGVSQYPKHEGRFPQVAGVVFGFDPEKPSGKRVPPHSVKVQGEKLVMDRNYRVSTKHYIAQGKDGYECFKNCRELVNEEDGPRLSTIVQNHFEAVAVMKGKKKHKFQHHQSLIPVSRRRTMSKQFSLNVDINSSTVNTGPDEHDCIRPESAPITHAMPGSCASAAAPPQAGEPHPHLLRHHTVGDPARATSSLRRRSSIQSVEADSCSVALAPQVEGRIFIAKPSTRHNLEKLTISYTPTIPEDNEADTT